MKEEHVYFSRSPEHQITLRPNIDFGLLDGDLGSMGKKNRLDKSARKCKLTFLMNNREPLPYWFSLFACPSLMPKEWSHPAM